MSTHVYFSNDDRRRVQQALADLMEDLGRLPHAFELHALVQLREELETGSP